MSSRLIKLFVPLAIVALALVPGAASAQEQDLVVRPMKVEADVPGNRTARVILTVRNRHATRTEPINLEVVDLTQSRDGTLRIVTEDTRAELDESALRASSRTWLELPAERIEIAPKTTAEIPVLIRVPPRARGTYVSAVRIQTDTPSLPEATGAEREAFFAVRFGFLIPLITGIEGRTVRQNISATDVSMTFDAGMGEAGNQRREPTTRAAMEIVNDGQTYSSLKGEIRVERRTGENWRLVTRAELPTAKILPGIALELTSDLERRLPSGDYRLIGTLMVDGRRTPRIEKEFTFEGDPETDSIAFDTALSLAPATLSVEAIPGSTRSSTVAITNPGDQPITVQITVKTPESLRKVAMGDLLGEDLSAAVWSDIRPAEFTIRPGARRNVRVMSRLPKDGVEHANYYADIILSSSYADGQSAGETRSSLHVRQEQVEQQPAGVVSSLSMAEGEEPFAYFAQLRFINTGNVHLEPTADVRLFDAGGTQVAGTTLTTEDGVLLPLGTRDFGGELDLSDLEPGQYLLRATVAFDAGTAVKEHALALAIEERVNDDGETVKVPHVAIVDPTEAADASAAPAGDGAAQDDGNEADGS